MYNQDMNVVWILFIPLHFITGLYFIQYCCYAVFFSVSHCGNRKNADYSITPPARNTRKKRNRTWCGAVVSQSFSPFAHSTSRGFRESLPRPTFEPPHHHIYTLRRGRMRRILPDVIIARTHILLQVYIIVTLVARGTKRRGFKFFP